jgi:PPOX class probable F420-dependent enzyme
MPQIADDFRLGGLPSGPLNHLQKRHIQALGVLDRTQAVAGSRGHAHDDGLRRPPARRARWAYDPAMIDQGTEFGVRVARHLREDPVVWLTTVSGAGAPLPTPVWFVWDGNDSLLVFSLAGAARVRHLAANPRVSLNFAGDGRGGDIVVFSGRAAIDATAGPADRVDAYVEKYATSIQRIGLTAEQFAQRYSVPLRITITRVRGH